MCDGIACRTLARCVRRSSVRIVPAALVAATAAAMLALGAGPAAAEQVTPDHTVAVDNSQSLAVPQTSDSNDNRDM
jgi:hypothetical protein